MCGLCQCDGPAVAKGAAKNAACGHAHHAQPCWQAYNPSQIAGILAMFRLLPIGAAGSNSCTLDGVRNRSSRRLRRCAACQLACPAARSPFPWTWPFCFGSCSQTPSSRPQVTGFYLKRNRMGGTWYFGYLVFLIMVGKSPKHALPARGKILVEIIVQPS